MVSSAHLWAFVLTSFVLISGAVAARSAPSWFACSPKRLSYLGGTGGVVMVGISARLALTGQHN